MQFILAIRSVDELPIASLSELYSWYFQLFLVPLVFTEQSFENLLKDHAHSLFSREVPSAVRIIDIIVDVSVLLLALKLNRS